MSRLYPLLALPLIAVTVTPALPDVPSKEPPPAPRVKTICPMFGGTPARNMVNHTDRNLPDKFDPDKDCLWKADLGSRSYGHPVVAAGKVFVGTNNERPRNPRDSVFNFAENLTEPIDRGVLMGFDEKTGKFLWQAVFPKLASGQVNDWPKEGVCASAAVDGDRVYFVSNRCTVVCADVNGRHNGVQGIRRPGFEDPTDADILWEYDMIRELKVFPHNMSLSHPLIVGDLLFVCTSNGVDEGHFNIPAPDAPSFIALDKTTGKLVWKDNSPGKDIMHGQWNSAAYTADPVPQVIFPGGDGWLRAFDPPTGKLLWKFDANAKDGVYELGGSGTKNDFIAAPVVYDHKVYIAVGQDPEHTDGIGRLWCIDVRKAVANAARNPARDVSLELVAAAGKRPDGTKWVKGKANPDSAAVWAYGGEDPRPWSVRDFLFGRTMCTACIADDILYIGDMAGFVHCFHAQTGQHYWQYDTRSSLWFSGPTYADGKVYVGTDNSELCVFKHTKTPAVIDDIDPTAPNRRAARAYRRAMQQLIANNYLAAKVEFDAPIRASPCVANGVLYVMTERTLYAFGKRQE